MTWWGWPVVGLLGGAGALARFGLESLVRRGGRRRPAAGIAAVNLSGAAALGFIAGSSLRGEALTLVASGLLGSYTTFSGWMLEARAEAAHGRRGRAVLDVTASLAVGLGAVALGRAVTGGF